ncbi:MAG: 30S ribosomal protein S5 [Planctomycetes bacterium]|jgi:small subunit ribosomal protein S5|nr:30S ribosomal protein S5 [Planctomycetota bacterium]
MAEKLRDKSEDTGGLESTTVGIFRTSKTVKGGRNFSFAALVVVGDRKGNVGIGYGKGPGVPAGIEKAQKDAKKKMFTVNLNGGTLPHEINGRFKSSTVRLLPAAPGTGVIAGGTVRAVLEMAGVQDCLTKAYGSTNKLNLCKAVIEGLKSLRTRETVAALRGVQIEASAVDEILAETRKSDEEAEAEVAQPLKTKPAPKPAKAEKPAKPEPTAESASESGAAATAVAEAPEPSETGGDEQASSEEAKNE